MRMIGRDVLFGKFLLDAVLSLGLFVGASASASASELEMFAGPLGQAKSAAVERGTGPRMIFAANADNQGNNLNDESSGSTAVRIQYIAGTAFLAYVCVYRQAAGKKECGGTYGVGYDATWKNLTYQDAVCIYIISGAEYVFYVKSDAAANESMKFWGLATDPQWSITSGLTYVGPFANCR